MLIQLEPCFYYYIDKTSLFSEEIKDKKNKENEVKTTENKAKLTSARQTRPKRPQKRPNFKVVPAFYSQPRPKSAPPARVRPKDPADARPPFLPYGYHDKERTVGTKKTHNVRASAEVKIKQDIH